MTAEEKVTAPSAPIPYNEDELPHGDFMACLLRGRAMDSRKPLTATEALFRACWPGSASVRATLPLAPTTSSSSSPPSAFLAVLTDMGQRIAAVPVDATDSDEDSAAAAAGGGGTAASRPGALVALLVRFLRGTWACGDANRVHGAAATALETLLRDTPAARGHALADVERAIGASAHDRFLLAAIAVLSVLCRCALSLAVVHADPATLRLWQALHDAVGAVHTEKAFQEDALAAVGAAWAAFPVRRDPFAWCSASVGPAARAVAEEEPCRVPVHRLAALATASLGQWMAAVAAIRRPRSPDPIYEYAAHVCLAVLYAGCVANDVTPDAALLRCLAVIVCRGPTVAALRAVAQLAPRAVAVVTQTATAMRLAREVVSVPLSREVADRQYAAMRQRYGVLLTHWDACLVACTRCKHPHSIQSCRGVAGVDGHVNVRCDVIAQSVSCRKKWGGEPARLYHLLLLGHIVVTRQAIAYTICCTCGNRAEVDMDEVGYSAEACFNCREDAERSAARGTRGRRGRGRGRGGGGRGGAPRGRRTRGVKRTRSVSRGRHA